MWAIQSVKRCGRLGHDDPPLKRLQKTKFSLRMDHCSLFCKLILVVDFWRQFGRKSGGEVWAKINRGQAHFLHVPSYDFVINLQAITLQLRRDPSIPVIRMCRFQRNQVLLHGTIRFRHSTRSHTPDKRKPIISVIGPAINTPCIPK